MDINDFTMHYRNGSYNNRVPESGIIKPNPDSGRSYKKSMIFHIYRSNRIFYTFGF